MTNIGIVVLHYKDRRATAKCLESIVNLQKDGLEMKVIVVNNDPRESLGDLEEKFPGYFFVTSSKNLGFSAGNNLGIKKALEEGSDWVFLINNDAFVDKCLLVQLIKQIRQNSQIGIVGPKIYFAPGYEYHSDRYKDSERGKIIWYAGGINDWQNVLSSHRGVDEVDKGQYSRAEETDFVSGCAMMVKKEVFEKIGFLDEKYFLYLEDNDFCQRAKRAGFKVVYSPGGCVWHANAGSSKVGGMLQDYFITRNRLLFGLRYAPLRSKLALFRESAKILFNGRPWQKIGVKDFYLRKFNKGSWHG